mgnify:CR=1 FL=1
MNRKILSMKTRIHNALSNERGDFYISDGVKIIIAVVLGALLLAALTNIFNPTVIPRITTEITNLFSYFPFLSSLADLCSRNCSTGVGTACTLF